MSIQGWFHAAQAPDNAELATRNQLQLRAGEDTAHDFKPFSGGWGGGHAVLVLLCWWAYTSWHHTVLLLASLVFHWSISSV
jgi:hypothetical protein